MKLGKKAFSTGRADTEIVTFTPEKHGEIHHYRLYALKKSCMGK